MSEDIQEIRDRIDDIAEAADRLQELGDREDVPAVERTAKRIRGTLTTLDSNVPPELTEE